MCESVGLRCGSKNFFCFVFFSHIFFILFFLLYAFFLSQEVTETISSVSTSLHGAGLTDLRSLQQFLLQSENHMMDIDEENENDEWQDYAIRYPRPKPIGYQRSHPDEEFSESYCSNDSESCLQQCKDLGFIYVDDDPRCSNFMRPFVEMLQYIYEIDPEDETKLKHQEAFNAFFDAGLSVNKSRGMAKGDTSLDRIGCAMFGSIVDGVVIKPRRNMDWAKRIFMKYNVDPTFKIPKKKSVRKQDKSEEPELSNYFKFHTVS